MENLNDFTIEINEEDLNPIEDIYNSNIEIFVRLKDGFTLTIIVGTPQNLEYLMKKDNVDFLRPGLPWIIVQKITKEIIQKAVKNYMDDKPDGYWLKLYHFANNIDIAEFDRLQTQETTRSTQFDLYIGLDELKSKINKFDTLKKSELITHLDKLYKHVNSLD
jgi:hypothetical protein